MSVDFGCLTDIKFLLVNQIKYKCINLVLKEKEFDLVLAPHYFVFQYISIFWCFIQIVVHYSNLHSAFLLWIIVQWFLSIFFSLLVWLHLGPIFNRVSICIDVLNCYCLDWLEIVRINWNYVIYFELNTDSCRSSPSALMFWLAESG